MPERNPKVDILFAKKLTAWHDEMSAIRAILLGTPLTEEFKWRSACYTYEGSNVAMIGGYKDNCVLSFFKGVLLKDAENILAPPGKNSRSARVIRFTSVSEVEALEPVIKAYVQEAIEHEKAGRTVAFEKDDLDYPEELTAILDTDPDLKAAFQALTPGRRRGYILHFSVAKQSKTRRSRIEKSAPRILEGKGMHDR